MNSRTSPASESTSETSSDTGSQAPCFSPFGPFLLLPFFTDFTALPSLSAFSSRSPRKRFVVNCCAIDTRLFENQYSTKPAGAMARMNVNMIGMNDMIFCCIGSALVCGVIFWMAICVAPMRTGKTNHGS